MTSNRVVVLALLLLLTTSAGCSKDTAPTAATTPSCTLSTGAISASTFGAPGGTGSVAITAASNCSWTSTSSATFVTISAGASGAGNGTTSFTVAPNTGAARTATLTVAGTAFTISQSASVTPTAISLSAPTATSPIGGQAVNVGRPALVVTNAAATGAVGTVTYRFEISEQPTFPIDSRTLAVDDVPQATATTSFTVTHELAADTLFYWHARATNGTVTSAYSPTETFRTVLPPCSFTVAPTAASVGSTGGTITVTVTAGNACSWTAASNAAFLTVGGPSGTGSGAVTATVASNSGAPRSGTLTIAGQTVTISQNGGAEIAASFQLFDPGISGNPTTECRITSGLGTGNTCTLRSTSFPLGTTGLVSFAWSAQWTDGTVITRTQDGPSSTFDISHTCGGPRSSAEGTLQPLSVTLTVTDSAGNTATVTTGSGNQPPLFMRLFKC